MFDALTQLLMRLSTWHRSASTTLAIWVSGSIASVVRPPTPVYLPKFPMTDEEIERVGRPVDASAPPKRDEFYQD